MSWQNGLPEAITSLSAHVGPFGNDRRPPERFDARDREALAFVLAELGRLRGSLRLEELDWSLEDDERGL